MRVAPGQAVTFAVYEKLKSFLEGPRLFQKLGEYEE